MNYTSKNLTIIFGAGASHDSGAYAPERDNQGPPPLARDLFAPAFDDILDWHPQLRRRVPEVRLRLAKEQNIEEILRDLYSSAAKHAKYWPYQIPLYLRHLFWEFSLYCERGSTNFDVLVRPVLESSFDKVMFISLNYDLLLDSAIAGYESPEWTFETMSSYIPEDKKWLLVKPHGSINWARAIDNCPSDEPFGDNPRQLNEMPHFLSDAEPRVTLWARQNKYPYVPASAGPAGGYLYPQIVIPADNPKNFACPASHIEQASAFIKNCANFLFIGFSGHDMDVIRLLEPMPNHSRLDIIGKGRQDAQRILQRIHSQSPGLQRKELAPSFHNGGFFKFIKGDALEEYLKK